MRSDPIPGIHMNQPNSSAFGKHSIHQSSYAFIRKIKLEWKLPGGKTTKIQKKGRERERMTNMRNRRKSCRNAYMYILFPRSAYVSPSLFPFHFSSHFVALPSAADTNYFRIRKFPKKLSIRSASIANIANAFDCTVSDNQKNVKLQLKKCFLTCREGCAN